MKDHIDALQKILEEYQRIWSRAVLPSSLETRMDKNNNGLAYVIYRMDSDEQ